MRIGELSARTGVSTRLLRYYEQQGLLSAARDANDYRSYADDAVLRVRQIRTLLAAGLPTAVIVDALRCASGEDAHLELCPQLAQQLHRRLSGIDAQIGDLQQQRTRLSEYLSG
ncbi:MerR family transcriptional regulator [Mycobacterium sp. MS1601]|uniref:MerR family transcriptional regulator n=1 Tax=Mycobacterium sp. MS1601 TaxID=1936029 RepID=UPI0009790A29|nr:MerR family transcriptional regulator [Mycobacterium sp. MS1601]AQA06139.1 MerR family transcriptional regulator [Mycobacterium sp. MS1601]